MNKKSQKTYTTKEISKLTGLTEVRIHQMRNGQSVNLKKINKVYHVKPILEKGVHWDWNESDVMIFEKGLEMIQSRRKRTQPIKVVSNTMPEENQITENANV
jgi:hypothetical protein